MITAIIPKLPMRDLKRTREYYTSQLNFIVVAEFGNYLIVRKENLEIHFFEFIELDPKENYGQIYIRTDDIEALYLSLIDKDVEIHPNGALQTKAWGQKEFSLLDPDNNLITFGQLM
jgi:catechol 2,3-dioxygenase-like lactoylglutathione lyase family enzyme